MIRVYNINELTMVPFLLAAMLGSAPYVLAIEALFPPLNPLLEKLAEAMIARGRARRAIELAPEYNHVQEYPSRILLYDIFADSEEWQNRHYGFDAADEAAPDYAFAYRQVTCNYARLKHFPWLLIEAAIRGAGTSKIRFIGLPFDTVSGLEAYWGRNFTPMVKPMRFPNAVANFFTAIAVTKITLVWIVSRIRPWRKAGEPVFFAADYMEDPKDMALYDEIADGGSVLLVQRDPSRKFEPYDRLRPYQHCLPRDGFFTLSGALGAIAFVLKDGLCLFRHFFRKPPALFYQVATLPWRRAVLRAFFTRFHPKFYWGRDDYNVEHILRRQELHRVGGTSLGINHGYPAYACAFPMWRYISFDRYYAFGRALYERHMKSSWASDMQICPVGTFVASREDYSRAKMERPKDIVIFTAAMVGDERMIKFIRELAAAFRDRKILLQVKHLFVDQKSGRNFITACQDGLPNVVHTRENVYMLFEKARYALSDPSTVVVEAIQFGLASWCIDLCPYQKSSLLREFEGLCLSEAEEAITRIHAIEAGETEYPRMSYGELIELSNRPLYDILREDLGLAVLLRENPRAIAI
jgi:hypothetical protein